MDERLIGVLIIRQLLWRIKILFFCAILYNRWEIFLTYFFMTNDSNSLFSNLSRELFDHSDEVTYDVRLKPGLDEEVVRTISADNNEPVWMLELRLKAFEIYRSKTIPTWWPDLSALDLDKICYFSRALKEGEWKSWEEVPDNIKNTFERLGIPEAERTILAWVWAQYDSEVVYHSLKQELSDLGVIFEDMSVAIHKHEDLLRKYFSKCVPITDHKFAALHYAVWSGGTFLYVPAGVKIEEPLQAYFRMNVRAGGQFEHTLMVIEDEASAHYIEWCSAPKYGESSLHAGCVEIFVGKHAKMRYSSVENWSIDTYNLNTKRAIVQDEWYIEWVGGNMGSGVTMLYPCSILLGARSACQHTGIAFANAGQVADTGAKVVHIGEGTSSNILMKSLSKGWGNSTYRWLIDIKPTALHSTSKIDCDALLLDEFSISDTIPDIRVGNTESVVAHEATAGKINEEDVFYLASRGMNEEGAKKMIVNGFISPIIRELPLEYAAEMNILIGMEMEGGF